MRVVCVIPWRGGDEYRDHNYRAVRGRLERILPAAVHVDADDGTDPFSRAGSRNHGVRLAEQHDSDVVVLCDADTIPEPATLYSAIEAAHTDGVLHLPYTRYRGLTHKGTLDYLAGSFPEECETELAHEWATGGVMVITPDTWWSAGGMDERFRSYGFEDVALRLAADTLLGPTVRHDGEIVHLWHPKTMGLGSPEHTANGKLCARYNQANGDPDAMRALIAERETVTGGSRR